MKGVFMKKNGHLFFEFYSDFKNYLKDSSFIDNGISSKYKDYYWYIVDGVSCYVLISCIYVQPVYEQISF